MGALVAILILPFLLFFAAVFIKAGWDHWSAWLRAPEQEGFLIMMACIFGAMTAWFVGASMIHWWRHHRGGR